MGSRPNPTRPRKVPATRPSRRVLRVIEHRATAVGERGREDVITAKTRQRAPIAHRPITRKSAAESANSLQVHYEVQDHLLDLRGTEEVEIDKTRPSIEEEAESEDIEEEEVAEQRLNVLLRRSRSYQWWWPTLPSIPEEE